MGVSGSNTKKIAGILILCITLSMAMVLLSACGETASNEGDADAEAEAEARVYQQITDYYTDLGFEVAKIEPEEEDNTSIKVTMTTEMKSKKLKKLFDSSDEDADDFGWTMFHDFADTDENGFAPDDALMVHVGTIVINDATYVLESTDDYWYVAKDGKEFVAEKHEETESAEDLSDSYADSGAGDDDSDSDDFSYSYTPTNYAICLYIYERYDYYDELYGTYTEDMFDDEVFEDAAHEFGITVEQAKEAWFDYDANRQAMTDHYGQ